MAEETRQNGTVQYKVLVHPVCIPRDAAVTQLLSPNGGYKYAFVRSLTLMITGERQRDECSSETVTAISVTAHSVSGELLIATRCVYQEAGGQFGVCTRATHSFRSVACSCRKVQPRMCCVGVLEARGVHSMHRGNIP